MPTERDNQRGFSSATVLTQVSVSVKAQVCGLSHGMSTAQRLLLVGSPLGRLIFGGGVICLCCRGPTTHSGETPFSYETDGPLMVENKVPWRWALPHRRSPQAYEAFCWHRQTDPWTAQLQPSDEQCTLCCWNGFQEIERNTEMPPKQKWLNWGSAVSITELLCTTQHLWGTWR